MKTKMTKRYLDVLYFWLPSLIFFYFEMWFFFGLLVMFGWLVIIYYFIFEKIIKNKKGSGEEKK